MLKPPGGWVVNIFSFESQGLRFKSCWRYSSAHVCTVLYCTEPSIIILPLSLYDFNPLYTSVDSPHYILEQSNFNFRYVCLWDLGISREKCLNYLQMRCPTGDQVTGSTPAEVGNILSWRLIMKYFLWSFSPFRWFKKGSCQFLAKECAQYWLTA